MDFFCRYISYTDDGWMDTLDSDLLADHLWLMSAEAENSRDKTLFIVSTLSHRGCMMMMMILMILCCMYWRNFGESHQQVLVAMFLDVILRPCLLYDALRQRHDFVNYKNILFVWMRPLLEQLDNGPVCNVGY